MTKILLFLDGNRAKDLSLIGACERMTQGQDAQIIAIGFPENCPAGDSAYDEVLMIKDQRIVPYDTMALTQLLQEVHLQYHFDIILLSATPLGRILAPRLAIALHTGLVADVTDIDVVDGVIHMIRPAYSGKLMARIIATGTGPVMMTVRPYGFEPADLRLKTTRITSVQGTNIHDSGIILLHSQAKTVTEDIRDSQILISGGGGVLTQFHRLQELATVLHAQVSASRRVVDSGVVHRKIQVGQSGKTVSPKLYIALGISGSVQHIEGLKNVETIIAVNTNKNAPICSLAALVVEGDAVDFIDKLVKKIKQTV